MISRSQFTLLLALLACGALPFLQNPLHFNAYYVDVAIKVAINITLAVSLNLINGYTGQFSLGHAGFMGIGAYSAAAVTLFAGPAFLKIFPYSGSPLILFLMAAIIAGISAALVGLIVGIPSLRLRGDYLAIVTLGFGEIIGVIIRNIGPLGGALGLNGIPNYTTLFWAFSFAAITIYCVFSLVHSTYGRGFLAVHDDEVAAEAMGINSTRYKITAFVIGAFFAGIGGALYAHHTQAIDPSGFDFVKSVEIVVMVILGGMGNTRGVIVAAILLTVLPEFLRPLATYRMIIYALLIIFLMLLCPNGLAQMVKMLPGKASRRRRKLS
ncbi:MAG: inner-rane translocator [Verrucomicrobiales bacterium]|nr:inner-rane translocator [Verrucomicrobiales bacterium]